MTPCIAIIESGFLASAGLRVLLGQGLINKEIADRLGIAVTTVIFHRNNLCAKMGRRLSFFAEIN